MRVRSRPSSVDRTGRAIVLMQGPYDSRGKKVNEVNTYDVFGSHNLVDLNGAGAAVRAGYAKRSARQTASHLLTKHDIKALVQEKQLETEERLQITRDDVIRGLQRAVQEAKAAGSPMGMIRAYREIGLMMGYYDRPVAPAPQDVNDDQLRSMSDTELQALVCDLEMVTGGDHATVPP